MDGAAGEPVSFRLSGRDALLGRDATCDIVIEHPTVSGRHALLRAAGDGYTFTDLGSRNGSAIKPADGAARSLDAGEELTLVAGMTLLLGGADEPVQIAVRAAADPFAPSTLVPGTTAAPATGGRERTIIAAQPLSDLFVAAPDVLAGLAAEAIASGSAEDLAESAVGFLRALFPHAEGHAVLLAGAGFTAEAGDEAPASLEAKAVARDEVVLYEQGDGALPVSESVARAGIQAAVVAPLRAGGAAHGHLLAWSSLGAAVLPASALQQLAVAASLVALAASAIALRRKGEVARRCLEEENEHLRDESSGGRALDPIGSAPSFVAAVELCRSVAPADVPLLLLGETGSGKEILARGVHRWSRRGKKSFVAFNCAAIPESLIESELFGHVRGAFTGATTDRPGLFEEADGGTIFLDEIGEMPAVMQAKLLRVLQEGEVRRVGASKPKHVDVRVVSATHRDLPTLVAEGSFRADLMYRLNAVTVRIPPLRERRPDISLLAHHLLGRASALARKTVSGFSPEALGALARWDWPGNVRELENEVLRAVALTPEGAAIRPITFSPAIAGLDTGVPGHSGEAGVQLSGDMTLREAVEAAERAAITAALEASEGNVSAASRQLGLTRPGLYKVMERLGLRR